MSRKKVHVTPGRLVEWGKAHSAMSVSLGSKRVGTVWNDSRKVKPGDVFAAIETGQDDGHNYVRAAFEAGAIAAIVEKSKVSMFTPQECRKLIVVRDTLAAVQRMACRYRDELGILFIGITGSSGKTTTRTFLSSVLRQGLEVGETFGNWNNHIGVPLSILRFTGNEWAGVIEMGANHVREIHALSKIVRPDIAIVTNVGYGHVGLFGSIANTTEAKFEIADGLNRKAGFLLLNGDDPRLVAGAKERNVKSVFFGTGASCDIRAERIEVNPASGVSFEVDGYSFTLAMPGRHFVYCALPAIAVGRRCGIPDRLIARALGSQKPVAMRGAIEKKKGVAFIVDCYNANPSSMKAGIEYLRDVAAPSRRVAIVGDMLELGSYSTRLHKELGKQLALAQVKNVLAVGEYGSCIAAGARAAGMSPSRIMTATNAHDAAGMAKILLRTGDVALIKGSRGVHLEVVFEQF